MKSISTLLPSMAVLLLALVFPERNCSADNRLVSISDDRLRVTLATPSGLLAVDDLDSGVHWVQYVPSRVAQGREWGKVTTRKIPQSELVRIEETTIRAADEAGYLIGGYHNYSWIQARWIDHDPALKDAAVTQADGTFKTIANAWDAKGRLDRCPAAHRSVFIEKGKLARELGVNYFFTDCTTTGGSIQECYHPEHPLTRQAGANHLNEALQGLGRLGLVVGSERGKWWAAPTTDVFEGIETLIEYGGSYYGSGNDSHWVGPYLKSKPGYRELFLGFDFNPARRVPLFQLVYHDSVYCTRRWNQDPGRDLSLWNRHDLMNILYGTPPLWFMHPKAGNVIGTPQWERVKGRYLQTYRRVCGWHEKIGFDEMTDHRFLSNDRLVQETRFSSGWTVVVNFREDPWNDPRGFHIPPHDDHAFME